MAANPGSNELSPGLMVSYRLLRICNEKFGAASSHMRSGPHLSIQKQMAALEGRFSPLGVVVQIRAAVGPGASFGWLP